MLIYNDIKPINQDYKDYYDNNFKSYLSGLINFYLQRSNNMNQKINEITPEFIFYILSDQKISTFFDIDDFLQDKNVIRDNDSLLGYDFFDKLESYINDTLDEDDDFESEIYSFNRNINKNNIIKINNNKNTSSKIDNTSIDNLDTNRLNSNLSDIKHKFIGHEEVVDSLFYNIVNNQVLSGMSDIPSDVRSVIFLDGPTGTGKTAITKEITDKLDIPFSRSTVTDYSATGYVGGNLTDILKELFDKADGDLDKAEKGIVVLDEFDKLASSEVNDLIMKRAIQQQLLDFMGGGKYTIDVSDDKLFPQKIDFDTSKLTFVCLGALTNLREEKTKQNKSFGFSSETHESSNQDYDIKPSDLIDMGMERELVGRINVYLHTKEYSIDDLERILRESSISPLDSLVKLAKRYNKELNFSDDVYHTIAKNAYELHIGARALQTVVYSIRNSILKELIIGNSKTINTDSNMVNNIFTNTFKRESR